MRPCGSCAQECSPRRLLGHPSAVAPPPSLVDMQRAQLDRVIGVTTMVLFAISMVYITLSSIYSYLRHRRQEQGADGDPPGPSPAAAEETKRALEEIPVAVHDGRGGDDGCAVCLAEYAAGDEVRVLPSCRHGFHKECVDQWLLTRAPTCPVCRASVVPVEKQDTTDCDGGNAGRGIGGVAIVGFRVLPML